ncbi:MAG: protein kinase, partial [Pseudomonadota bacterium]
MTAPDDRALATGGGLEMGAALLATEDDSLLGIQLGDYRLVEVIGDGGMSRIYRAERADGSFERQVAIKLSIGGSISTELRRRFSQEQTLLASLDHPHISRLYDAQFSADGRPYIVMELIEGETVDDYCDARGNTVDLAVTLVRDIAAAVAYAHAHLIVHRDIKPGNVMVDRFNQPKLLDFGIAKLLEGDGVDGTLAPPMTPLFASPEQLLGRPVTIASDIYQLGALLYRLVSGRPLMQEGAVDQAIARASQGEDLILPQEDRRRIPRDLQLIIQRCLRCEPQTRYPSADALRKDLEAFQGGYPVEVANRSWRYRANRFLRRNRAMVGVVTVATVLLAGATYSYTRSLAESRELAESRAQSATRTSKALSRLLTESMSDLQDQVAEHEVGASTIVKSVFEDAIRLASLELGADDAAKADLIRVRANAEWRLGRLEEASASFEEAGLLSSAQDDPSLFAEIQLDSIRLALEERQIAPSEEALRQLEQKVSVNTLKPLTQARYHRTRGYLHHAKDEFDLADAAYLQALDQLDALGPEYDRERADLLTDLAWVHIGREQYDKTRDYAKQSVALLEQAESPMSHRLINPLRTLALALGLLDEYPAARETNQRALEIAQANYGDTHRAVGRVHSSLSSLLFRQGEMGEAIEHEQEALRIEQALYGGDSWDALVTRNTLVLYRGSAGFIAQALAESDHLLSELTNRTGPEGRRNLEVLLANRSRFLALAGKHEEAVAASRESLALRRALQGEGSYGDFDSQRELSYLLLSAGKIDEARSYFAGSLAGLRSLRGDEDEEYRTWALRGYLFDWATGDLVAARSRLQKYVALTEKRYVLDSPLFLSQLVDLAEICAQLADAACARHALNRVDKSLAAYPEHPDTLRAQLVAA